ncbi:unnamed protein product, partial [Owenia fusiformis]
NLNLKIIEMRTMRPNQCILVLIVIASVNLVFLWQSLKSTGIKDVTQQSKDISAIIKAKRMVRDETCEVMLNIITTFPVLQSLREIKSHGFGNISLKHFQDRQMEFVQTLSSNIKHPCVERIHLLVENVDVEEYIKTLDTKHFLVSDVDTMVRFYKLSNFPTYRDYAQYVNENLMFKNIAIMNADISLGDGFNRIKDRFLVERRVAYSLTRHSSLFTKCPSNPNFCRQKYTGSHDVHIFYMDTPFDKWSLHFLTYPINRLGAENLFMHVVAKRLNKTVLNPCSILKTHHNHCSGLRAADSTTDKKRINWGKNYTYSTKSGYSQRLF